MSTHTTPPHARPSQPLRRLAIAGALVLSVAGLTACGDDDTTTGGTTTRPDAVTTTEAPVTSTTSAPPTSMPVDGVEVLAYLLRDEKVAPVRRIAPSEGVAGDAIEALLAGPSEAEVAAGYTSAVPAGTELLGVDIDGGVATVDLSEKFNSGGGTASMMGRIAQVVFTLTQFDTITSVTFRIEGEDVISIGGEGILVDEPQTREMWEESSPAILLESPSPFEEVSSPLQLTGTANTFEATFMIKVTDADGEVLYDNFATATSGSGTRGSFDVTVEFDAGAGGSGTVTVYESSAQDGSPINVVETPVVLTAS